ncbi:MAG: hypothetical protein QM817_10405 [Archangium sp.]
MKLPEAITAGEFEEHLLNTAPQDVFPMGGHKRVFRARLDDGHFEGLLLTLKNQKVVPLITASTLEVTVEQLERGTHMVDFNFFRWNSATGRGLMMTYFQSPGVQTIATLLEDQYEALRQVRISNETGPMASDAEKAKVRKTYKERLRVSRLASTETLEDLIDELTSITTFHVVGVEGVPASPYAPLTNFVKRRALTFTIEPKHRESSALRTAAKRVARALTREGKTGAIYGSVDGRDRTLDFNRNFDTFGGEEDFDTAARGVAMRLDNWAQSPLLEGLRSEMSAREDIFAAEEE